jgi:hypothetical protein
MEQFDFRRKDSKGFERLSDNKEKPRITIASIFSAQSKSTDFLKQYQNAQRVWTGISIEHIGWTRIKTSLNSTNIGRESLNKHANLKVLYDHARNYFSAKKLKPDVIILYLPGAGFQGIPGGLALAYDTKKPPYLIVISDHASDYPWVVAHEIGHIFYYSNSYYDKKDPNPYLLVNADGEPIRDEEGNLRFDTAHNNNQNNIMYPKATKSTKQPKVTSEQLKKATQSYLLERFQ